MKNTNQIYEAPCMRVQQAMAQTMLCVSGFGNQGEAGLTGVLDGGNDEAAF